VLALLWQALAMLLPAQVDGRASLISHSVAHWQETDHHHHADSSLHLEDRAEQSAHDHSHDGVQPSAILPSSRLFVARVPASGRVALVAQEPPLVFLKAPLRPPQVPA
jgi:hypothetical protein